MNMKPKIFLGTDHAGFELKENIKKHLQSIGFDVEDCGAFSYNVEDDYPEFILKAAKKVASAKNSRGIIFGGSGQGEAIVANKVKGIRAAVFYGDNLDIVKLSRTHNDSNILSIGARFVSMKKAAEAVNLWLEAGFGNEGRHIRRIKQIAGIEKKSFR